MRRHVAVLAVPLLIVSACSTQREDLSAAPEGTTCVSSAETEAHYEQAWSTAAEQLGLPELTPVQEKVCEVDTSAWAKEPKIGDRYRIAFAAQGPTNSWGMVNEEAFTDRAAQRDVDVLYASANGDATTQVDNIQQLVSQDPDALVVVPMGEGITGQVRAAHAQGIPVVACTGVLGESSGVVSTVTRQYELLGTAYAEWLVRKLGGKGEVAMLSGLAGVPTAEYQAAAAKRVFAKYPGIKVVTQQYTQWSPTVAKTVAANLLTAYPNLDGIWSDSGYGDLGVVNAYREAGKKVPPLTGDSSNAFLKAVQGSDVEFALSSFPPELSADCLDTALRILAGKPVLNKNYIDSPSFTHADTDKYVRPECGDSLFVPTTLSSEKLAELNLC